MTPAPRSSPAGCACRIRAWSSRSRSSATPAVRSGRPFRARLPLSLVSDQIHELGGEAGWRVRARAAGGGGGGGGRGGGGGAPFGGGPPPNPRGGGSRRSAV